jgi:hypothetical protein
MDRKYVGAAKCDPTLVRSELVRHAQFIEMVAYLALINGAPVCNEQ